ncbi:MAG: hypothetical protein WD013_01510 [Gemmatimonadota bacterium]
MDSLHSLGHTVRERGGVSGNVRAILIRADGTRLDDAVPRRSGAALGF